VLSKPSGWRTTWPAGVKVTLPVGSGALDTNTWSRHAPATPRAVGLTANTPGSGVLHGAARSPQDGHSSMLVIPMGRSDSKGWKIHTSPRRPVSPTVTGLSTSTATPIESTPIWPDAADDRTVQWSSTASMHPDRETRRQPIVRGM
jgi:hypothetical protein